MKSDTIIILAAAAAGLYAVARMTRKASGGANTAASLNMGGNVNTAAVQQIANTALPGGAGWGWQYFSDGTAIGPDGSYYLNGAKVWSPT